MRFRLLSLFQVIYRDQTQIMRIKKAGLIQVRPNLPTNIITPIHIYGRIKKISFYEAAIKNGTQNNLLLLFNFEKREMFKFICHLDMKSMFYLRDQSLGEVVGLILYNTNKANKLVWKSDMIHKRYKRKLFLYN